MCQQEGDPPRGQGERGWALIPGRRGGKAFADPSPKTCSHRKWPGSSRQGQAPQQRLGEGLRPGLCSWSSSSCGSACDLHLTSLLATQSPITEWPCLEQRSPGMVGLSWDRDAQLGAPGRDGGRDSGPEICVCCWLRGWRGAKEGGLPAAPQGCQEAKPLLWGPALWSFRPPSGRIQT